MEDKTSVLSEPAQLLLDRVNPWIERMPPETVDITQEIHPSEDDGYGSELLLSFPPRKLKSCSLSVGVIPHTAFPFHFSPGDLKQLARAEEVTISRFVAAQVPFFLEPQVVLSADEMFAVCEAVAAGSIVLTIGILHGALVSMEGYVETRRGILALQGTGGPMAVIRLARRLGCGEVRSVKFEPWV